MTTYIYQVEVRQAGALVEALEVVAGGPESAIAQVESGFPTTKMAISTGKKDERDRPIYETVEWSGYEFQARRVSDQSHHDLTTC